MSQRTIPLVLYGAAAAQVLPVLAAARYGVRLPSPRPWIVVWCAALLASDIAQYRFGIGAAGASNQWLQYIAVPTQNAIMLWALSLWQPDPVSRLAFRVAIPLDVIALLALIPAAESAAVFNQFTWPFQSLVLLAGSLYTLVRRAIGEPERVTSRDWFWVTLGTSLFFAFRMAVPPFANMMMASHLEIARLAYIFSAWIDILACVLIARGMLCPLPQARSGGSS